MAGDLSGQAKLGYNGNLLVENRHGLIVNTKVFEANGTAERDAALVMLEQIPGTRQVTVGGDKAYDTARNPLRMQPEPFPNHKITDTGERSKSQRPFFRNLLD